MGSAARNSRCVGVYVNTATDVRPIVRMWRQVSRGSQTATARPTRLPSCIKRRIATRVERCRPSPGRYDQHLTQDPRFPPPDGHSTCRESRDRAANLKAVAPAPLRALDAGVPSHDSSAVALCSDVSTSRPSTTNNSASAPKPVPSDMSMTRVSLRKSAIVVTALHSKVCARATVREAARSCGCTVPQGNRRW